MDTPEELLRIVESAAKKYGDVERAVKQSIREWRKTDQHAEYVEQMEYMAVQELVYRARHQATTASKNAAGCYGGPSKIDPAMREAAEASILDTIHVSGRRLGDVLGKEIAGLIDCEGALAAGHTMNQRLLIAIAPRVSEEKAVRQCVTAKEVFGALEDLRQGRSVALKPPKKIAKRSAKPEFAAAGH